MSDRRLVLEIRGLTRRFGGLTAVDRFDVDVKEGEIVSLVGPNGAGKTTVFNLISGVLKPTSGSVRMLRTELVGQPAHRITRLGVARTFQNIRVFAQLTVRENILLGTHHWTHSGMLGSATFWPATVRAERAAQAEVDTAIELFRERLQPRMDDPAFTLSYANRRRTEIARALAARPKLLLLDEQFRPGRQRRSEEHTSELQSPCNLVCRLLLEKKKNSTRHKIPSTLTRKSDMIEI